MRESQKRYQPFSGQGYMGLSLLPLTIFLFIVYVYNTASLVKPSDLGNAISLCNFIRILRLLEDPSLLILSLCSNKIVVSPPCFLPDISF